MKIYRPAMTTATIIAFCLAATIAQPARNTPAPQQLINQLWLVTFINDDGTETVASAPTAQNGQEFPLIAADEARRDAMIAVARYITKSRGIKMHLIKLSERTVVGDILP